MYVKREAGTAWRKANRSGPNGACVEASAQRGTVLVRDSKLGDSPVLDGAMALIHTVRGNGG